MVLKPFYNMGKHLLQNNISQWLCVSPQLVFRCILFHNNGNPYSHHWVVSLSLTFPVRPILSKSSFRFTGIFCPHCLHTMSANSCLVISRMVLTAIFETWSSMNPQCWQYTAIYSSLCSLPSLCPAKAISIVFRFGDVPASTLSPPTSILTITLWF